MQGKRVLECLSLERASRELSGEGYKDCEAMEMGANQDAEGQ